MFNKDLQKALETSRLALCCNRPKNVCQSSADILRHRSPTVLRNKNLNLDLWLCKPKIGTLVAPSCYGVCPYQFWFFYAFCAPLIEARTQRQTDGQME